MIMILVSPPDCVLQLAELEGICRDLRQSLHSVLDIQSGELQRNLHYAVQHTPAPWYQSPAPAEGSQPAQSVKRPYPAGHLISPP